MAIKTRDTPSRSVAVPAAHSILTSLGSSTTGTGTSTTSGGYSQLSQDDDNDALLASPPAYSNPFHRPIDPPNPYPPFSQTTTLPPPPVPQLSFANARRQSRRRPRAELDDLSRQPQPTNALAITHKHTGIKGVYCIDTSVIIPSHLLDPVPPSLWSVITSAISGSGGREEEEKVRLNAAFTTEHGREIDLILHVKGGGRANIRVERKGHGEPVRVAVASLASDTSLSLTIVSSSDIKIALPTNFRGLIKGGSERGSLKWSDSLRERTATFSVDQQNPMGGRYFVGDWRQAVSDEDAHLGTSGTFSDEQPPSTTNLRSSTTTTHGEDRKGPLLIAETAPEGYFTTPGSYLDPPELEVGGSASSSSRPGASSSYAQPQSQPWTGDLLTVTSEHGDISIETIEDRQLRMERRAHGWGWQVGTAGAECCTGFGHLVAACFGCPR
ncbi:hypothetical protein T439DRAFT_377731 [Meredithblackwellia eburnea MCA 4105]